MATNSYDAFGPTRARPKNKVIFSFKPLTTDGGRRLQTGATATTTARPATMDTAPDITTTPLKKPERRTVKQRYPYDDGRFDRDQKADDQ